MSVHTWRCRRVKNGVPCGTLMLARKRKCTTCGAPKEATRHRVGPKHRAVLAELPYEWWVETFGEVCGVCGKPPKPGKRLDRDHDHATGEPRGLLCGLPCNRALNARVTPEWLRAAADYLERPRPALPEREAA